MQFKMRQNFETFVGLYTQVLFMNSECSGRIATHQCIHWPDFQKSDFQKGDCKFEVFWKGK